MQEGIIRWLKDYATEHNKEGFVVGVSGGIDSAVVKELCVRTGLPVEGVEIPIDNNFPPLDYMFAQYGEGGKIAIGNLKARLRMAILYYIANMFGYLVVGTGNKSEITMGYFTKYGDGGCDILPIGDLTKTEVRALAKELGIPQEIIDKAPSAGLWEGQTDEEEMGITYEMIDKVIKAQESSRHKTEGIPVWKKR